MSQTPSKKNSSGYEGSDAKLKPLLLLAAGFTLAAVLGCAGMYWFYQKLQADDRRARKPLFYQGAGALPAPAPLLAVHPSREYEALRAQENALTAAYGWVDREKQIARIPVEKALEQVAAAGLPHRKSDEKN